MTRYRNPNHVALCVEDLDKGYEDWASSVHATFEEANRIPTKASASHGHDEFPDALVDKDLEEAAVRETCGKRHTEDADPEMRPERFEVV